MDAKRRTGLRMNSWLPSGQPLAGGGERNSRVVFGAYGRGAEFFAENAALELEGSARGISLPYCRISGQLEAVVIITCSYEQGGNEH